MKKVLVVYLSRTGNTEKMAKAIGDGIRETGVDVEVKKSKGTALDDLVAAEVVVLGSPTYFCTMSGNMKAFIDKSIQIYPDKLANKIGAAFGSYGWSGEAVKIITKELEAMNFNMIAPGLRIQYVPDKEGIESCYAYGRKIGKAVNE